MSRRPLPSFHSSAGSLGHAMADRDVPEGFAARHIGPDAAEIATMLDALGVASLEELIDRAVPDTIRDHERLDLPAPLSEAEALTWLRGLADRNQVFTSLIGQGYSNTFTPPVIQRNVLENPAWYTAYTPYQPEISQGRLEALLNFQTMVSDLTAMDMANASLLDEPTAAAEAMAMLHRVNGDKTNVFFVDHECHPQTIEVVRTRAEPIGIDIVVGDPRADVPLDGVFGVLLQYPGTTGVVRDDRALVDELHERGVLVAVAADLLALVLLAPPGEWGADVVVGSAQRFGVPMGYGGPHAGFLATRDAYRRNVPGRLVGVSVDAAGRPAMRLALQTREQHIRREKATSNICTAQVLLANIAGLYAVYHGPDGLRAIAERVHVLARTLADGLPVLHDSFFDTVSVRVANADDTLARSARRGDQPAEGRRRHGRHRARRDHDPRDRRRACARSSTRPPPPRTRPRPGSPPRCGAGPTSSRTRCSAPTTPSRRCCATCAGSPTATSHSTAR